MRTLMPNMLIVCLLSSAALSGQQSPADEGILRQRIAAHQLASEHGDIRGLVDIYAPDAQTVALNGTVLRGRGEIEADYRKSLLSASSRSGRHHTHPPDSVRIEFVTPDVALIEVASVNVGGVDAAGAALADARAQLVTIWRKQAGEWLVVYQRVVPRPAP